MIRAINLIVIRARNPEALRQFYTRLGLCFAQEQHGSGPIHFAAPIGQGGVLEIYPARRDETHTHLLTFGFEVDDPHAIFASAQSAGADIKHIDDKNAIIMDCEGNRLIIHTVQV